MKYNTSIIIAVFIISFVILAGCTTPQQSKSVPTITTTSIPTTKPTTPIPQKIGNDTAEVFSVKVVESYWFAATDDESAAIKGTIMNNNSQITVSVDMMGQFFDKDNVSLGFGTDFIQDVAPLQRAQFVVPYTGTEGDEIATWIVWIDSVDIFFRGD